MKLNNKISVVIPTYNSTQTLKECIKALQLQTLKPLEIIIVDNASSDGTEEMLKKNFPKIRLVRMLTNTGVTGGRNKGAEVAKGDYILFFDHDMDAKKNMLEELLKLAESNKKIGIVTPKIYFSDDKNIIWSAGTDINLLSGQTIFYGGKDVGQYNQNREVAVAPAALLVKREVIKKIGLFDNVYFATYEDTDFCFRAKKAGYQIFYAAKAIAYHRIPYDQNEANLRLLGRTYFVARNRIIFMKKYSSNFFIFALFIPIYFMYYALLAIKYSKIKPILEYLKGIIDGFKIALRNSVQTS